MSLQGIQESSGSVDLALEARATDTNSRYQLLDADNTRHKCSSWSKNKYAIIGILLISVLLAGSASFLVVYNQNQNLEQEVDRYAEIAQSEEAPYRHSNNGVVVVKDLGDNDNQNDNHKGKNDKTTPKPSRTTVEPSSKTSSTEKPKTTPDNSNNTIKNVTESGGATSSDEASTPIPSIIIDKDPIAYFNELKDVSATFLFEECVEKKETRLARHGFKCTAIVVTKILSSGRNFTGYGISKNKAKKTAAESAALTLFDARFPKTDEDLAAMEKVQNVCNSDKVTLVPPPPPKG